MQVGAIHAGLECGLLGDKIPGLDMVSYGPTIRSLLPLLQSCLENALAQQQALLQDLLIVILWTSSSSSDLHIPCVERLRLYVFQLDSLIVDSHNSRQGILIGNVAGCRGAHSPDETVQISTVEPFWDTTLQLLGRLADVKA